MWKFLHFRDVLQCSLAGVFALLPCIAPGGNQSSSCVRAARKKHVVSALLYSPLPMCHRIRASGSLPTLGQDPQRYQKSTLWGKESVLTNRRRLQACGILHPDESSGQHVQTRTPDQAPPPLSCFARRRNLTPGIPLNTNILYSQNGIGN